MRWRGLNADFRAWNWAAVGAWLLCFGLIVLLGLEGGGYDPLVHDQVGIAAWWALLLTIAVGALPRRRPGPARPGRDRAARCLRRSGSVQPDLDRERRADLRRTWAGR